MNGEADGPVPDPVPRGPAAREVEEPASGGNALERSPGVHPDPVAEAACLYTTTPDDDFVLDHVGRTVTATPVITV